MELKRRSCCLVGTVLCCLLVLEKTSGLEFNRSDFPSSFVFGSATSAYQVEGASYEDGRTPSIWDFYTHSGMMPDRSTGDEAVDGYHKYKDAPVVLDQLPLRISHMDDVKLMADMRLEAYRFSISWSRLIPGGTGDVNPAGLEYYNNLINELMKHGIQVHVMLYQLDLPEILEDQYESWLSPQIIDDFTAYADVCFREFGDRVKFWTTLSEPNVISLAGYDQGSWPPSRCSKPFGVTDCTDGNSTVEPYIVMHNLLLAHASAYNLYLTKYYEKQKGVVGINVYSFGVYPFSNSDADKNAVQRFRDFFIGWILDPLAFGDYPSAMKKVVGSRLPTFTNQQSKLLKGSFDFIGLNHYISLYIMDYSNITYSRTRDYSADTLVRITANKTMKPDSRYILDLKHVVPDPDGMQHMLEYIKKAYKNPPIYIHENGRGLASNSSLEDYERIEYIRSFISSTLNAIRNGVDVRGYFVWSFLDLFEFISGYETTFGLFSVDFNSDEKTRTPKLSAHWYSNFIKNIAINSTFVLSDGKYKAE